MALTEDGSVYTWGHNASGQLGCLGSPWHSRSGRQSQAAHGTGNDDLLRPSLTPIKVRGFGPTCPRAPPGGGLKEEQHSCMSVKATHVACGAEHSVAVDES
ncbi:unnamed protein product, partial [Discosporangium mesarthrocarpum]